eukprot:SAG11_NODE_663_length_7869_cov_146.101158_2_plen_145_part_00
MTLMRPQTRRRPLLLFAVLLVWRLAPHDSLAETVLQQVGRSAELLKARLLTRSEFDALKAAAFHAAYASPGGSTVDVTRASWRASAAGSLVSLPASAALPAPPDIASMQNVRDYGARGDASGITPADEEHDISNASWNRWELYL